MGAGFVLYIMLKRPICIIDGCKGMVAKHHKRKNGSWSYRKLCATHHRKKYKMSVGNAKRKRMHGETENMERSICLICGWNKAPCDRHRIKLGCDGGKYTLGNVLSVCPNCHRLIHMGLLDLT